MLILIVASGPDKGRMYELVDDQPVVLGRETGPVKLNDSKVSRKHAELICEGGRWYVKDLGSRHGTYRNHKPIEKGRKISIKDGDYLQIGGTVFVAARVSHEHAERLALIGQPPAGVNTGWTGSRRHRLPSPAAAAVIAAAFAVVGLNAYQFITTRNQTEQWREDFAAARSAASHSTDRVLARVDELNAEPLLRDVLASVKSQKHELLSDIRREIAAQPETIRPMLESILAKVQKQAADTGALAAVLGDGALNDRIDRLVAMLEAAQDDSAQQARFAEASRRDRTTHELLSEVLQRLDAQPAAADIDRRFADLHELIEQQPTRLEALLAEMRADEPTSAVDMDTLYAAISDVKATLPTDLSDQLDRVVAHLDTQPSPQQLAATVKAVNDEPNTIVPMLAELSAKLDAQPSTEQLTSVLHEVIDAQPGRVSPVIEQLAARLENQPTFDELSGVVQEMVAAQTRAIEPRFDELSARLDAQPTTAELLAAIDKISTSSDQRLTERLDQLAVSMHETATVDAQGVDVGALMARQQATADLLVSVLEELRNREPIDALRQEIAALASGASRPVAESPEAAEARRAIDTRLAQIESLLKRWPEQTSDRLDTILAAVKTRPVGTSDAAMAKVLSELHEMRYNGSQELRTAIRDELRTGLQQTRFALQPMATSQVMTLVPQPMPMYGQADATMGAPRNALQASPHTAAPTRNTELLTPTEEAYKLAFETGQPISIGGGTINPTTGEATPGRTLDPAAARTAGINTWREWYLMDDFAERMRLQKQAMHHLDNDSGSDDIIRLPAAAPPRD